MSSFFEATRDFLAFFGITMLILVVCTWILSTLVSAVVSSDMKRHVEKYHSSSSCETPKIPVEKPATVVKKN
jgi:hypothetical protein